MRHWDICVIDYGMGNLMSVQRALESIGCSVIVTNKAEEIQHSDRIVLPGVGAFSAAMEHLQSLRLIDLLTEEVVHRGKPFLGICLGMQLIAKESYEHGHHKGLGWIDASVIKLEPNKELRVPHMGWNEIIPVVRERSVFDGIDGERSYYFVHSYHVDCEKQEYIGSTCEYGQTFVSSIQHRNIYAAQFHPEKSQKNGISLLRNFIKWTAPEA
jgi:glutamine amidotransferase